MEERQAAGRAAAPDKSSSCLSLVATLRVTAPSSVVSGWFAPWGVQIAASFSKGSALRAFARAQHQYASVIGDMNPFVLGSVLRSCGWRPFYRAVRLPTCRPVARPGDSAIGSRPSAAPGAVSRS